MMPQINVSPSLFTQLQGLAEPFVDTPETVIQRCVEFYLSNATGHKSTTKASEPSTSIDSYMSFPVDAAPDLTFTRPMSIELEGKTFDKGSLYWNPLLFEVVRMAGSKGVKGDQLKQMLLCNYADGEADQTQGYRFIKEAGISVQGQAANPRLEDHLSPRQNPRADLGRGFHVGRQAQGRIPGQNRPSQVHAVIDKAAPDQFGGGRSRLNPWIPNNGTLHLRASCRF